MVALWCLSLGKLPYISIGACGLHSFNSGWDVACREVPRFIIRYLDWMCRIAQCFKEALLSPDVMHAPLLPQIALCKQKKYPLVILPVVRWPDRPIRPHAVNICLCAWEAWMCTITCRYHENSSWAWVGGNSRAFMVQAQLQTRQSEHHTAKWSLFGP